jgi:apolipoprotein N-acyltransferase
VDILLSPAYVWPEVAAIHAHMATFRFIENGMTVMHESDGGYSLISDPYGRVVAGEITRARR